MPLLFTAQLLPLSELLLVQLADNSVRWPLSGSPLTIGYSNCKYDNTDVLQLCTVVLASSKYRCEGLMDAGGDQTTGAEPNKTD